MRKGERGDEGRRRECSMRRLYKRMWRRGLFSFGVVLFGPFELRDELRVDQLADAEGGEGEETDDEEDDNAEVLVDVEERVRVRGVVGNEILEPEPVESGEGGDDGVAGEVRDIPALHEAEVVHGAAEQREEVDFDVEREGEGILLGDNQLRNEEFEGPVHEGDNEIE